MTKGRRTAAGRPTRTSSVDIGILVKFLDNRDHAEDFRDGLLYARRLKCFRKEEDPLRGDEHEGTILMGVKEISLRASDEDEWMTTKPIGPVRFNHPALDDLNIFCMTRFFAPVGEGSPREPMEDILRQIDDSLPVSLAMGQHAVVIMDVNQLLARVRKAAQDRNYGLHGNPVEYYDTYPATALTIHRDPTWRHAFLKSREYEKQREYRFAFETGTYGDDALRLNIGSLRDISLYIPTKDLADRSKWRVT